MEGTSARTIVPLMAFTTAIALIGHTFEATSGTSKLSPQVGDAQILLGGTIATVILTLLSTAGTVGDDFSKGLSVIALLSVVGLYGSSLLKGVDTLTGQVTPQGKKAATPTKGTTPS